MPCPFRLLPYMSLYSAGIQFSAVPSNEAVEPVSRLAEHMPRSPQPLLDTPLFFASTTVRLLNRFQYSDSVRLQFPFPGFSFMCHSSFFCDVYFPAAPQRTAGPFGMLRPPIPRHTMRFHGGYRNLCTAMGYVHVQKV
jgi:hypothetical protein